MSIPLDRLYHYIESIAQDIRGDNVVIYRFFPHGSKNVDDLDYMKPYTWFESASCPSMYCNDQEPLNFDYYETHKRTTYWQPQGLATLLADHNMPFVSCNFTRSTNIYDKNLLLHSEKRSADVEKYSNAAKKGMPREEFFRWVYGPTTRGKNFLGNQTDEDGGKLHPSHSS